MKIVVSKLCKMKEAGKTDPDSLIPITNSHLIEASITVRTGSEDPGRELQVDCPIMELQGDSQSLILKHHCIDIF